MGLGFPSLIQRLAAWRFRLGIARALALQRRGEVRDDGLKLKGLRARLEIEWYARDVHPWDRCESSGKKDALFVRNSLADTEAAIIRLFRFLPEIDVISVTVREAASESVIMAGTVNRSSVEPDAMLSVGMRLRQRGIKYHSNGSGFEPLETG